MVLLVFSLIYFLLAIYGFQALKSSDINIVFKGAYFVVVLCVLVNFIFQFSIDKSKTLTHSKSLAIGLSLSVFTFVFVLCFTMLIEDLVRVFKLFLRYFLSDSKKISFESRRKFVGTLALGLASIPFGALLYGMYKGKYNFKVIKHTLFFDDLPKSFDGFTLTHISDIHSGSLDNKEKIEYAVELINNQNSDVVFFTGDLVNNTADEMIPWKTTFSKIKASLGVYSVLGNHDYGDYVNWGTKEAKNKNLSDLIDTHRDIGFRLLLNENIEISKNEEYIKILGVENWGKDFKQKGDLTKALKGVSDNDFKILLSHDPTHWEEEVLKEKSKIHLTLSGHTHGMQFGIEIPGIIKWSPVKWKYKYWAGVYKEFGRFINVNRGFGYLAYPGRVGIWPEISVIELKHSDNKV